MGRTAVEMLLGELPLGAVLIPMPVVTRSSIRDLD
jgi:LacI family transcriptional regulator